MRMDWSAVTGPVEDSMVATATPSAVMAALIVASEAAMARAALMVAAWKFP